MTQPFPLRLTTRHSFAASLSIPDHSGNCSAPHGYRFFVSVTVSGNVDPTRPWLIDVQELDQEVQSRIIQRLDQKDLGQIVAYPSIEGTLIWIVDQMQSYARDVGVKIAEVLLEAPPTYAVCWSDPYG